MPNLDTYRPGDLRSPAQDALQAAEGYAGQSLSPATLRAYRADWAHFMGWCGEVALSPLPADPHTVAAYLASLAETHGSAALSRRLAAIGQAHRLRGFDWMPGHPAIRHTLRGIARQHGKPARQAAALCTAEIRALVATCDDGPAGLRDRALLLVGFAGALRRSELVGIEGQHLQRVAGGFTLLLPRSKGDQAGRGVSVGIPAGRQPGTCPVAALAAWLEVSGASPGPVFRKVEASGAIAGRALSADAVRDILRSRAARAGLEVGTLERLSPHGLRAGFITEAYNAGVRDELIMDHARHRDLKTMRGYVRRAKLVGESPAKALGL